MDLFQSALASHNTPEELIGGVRKSIIGRNVSFTTNLRLTRKLVYCDYFASGRSLSLIEDIIRDHIQPFYANTHTTSTFTGRFMTKQRELARNAIHRSLNADKAQYAVLFTGTGSTSGILHFANTLNLNQLNYWPPSNPPVVFISIMEHHSNILPWRESQAKVITIPMNTAGTGVDLYKLEMQLQIHQHSPLRIGSFSAGSNLTGVPINVQAISELLNRYNAHACFDYAGIAPYVPIDVAVLKPSALFFSPHKFMGGPSTPGVLVMDRDILSAEKIPIRPGGGSVSWVSHGSTEYVECLEEREEAGTQDIIGSIRAGMVFALKDTISPQFIQEHEFGLARSVFTKFEKINGLSVLGTDIHSNRIPVFSLVMFSPYFKSQRPLLLHHDFVSTLLNDLFGIQSRAGCMCAAIYGQYLLGNVSIPSSRSESPAQDIAESGLCPISPPNSDSTTPSVKEPLCPLANAPPKRPLTTLLTRTDSGILCDIDPSKPTRSRDTRPDSGIYESLRSSGRPIDEVTWPHALFKPGFLRVCFNYVSDHLEIEYVVRAIEWVARNGHLLLPYYQSDPRSGVWSVRENVLELDQTKEVGGDDAFSDAEDLIRPDVLKSVCEAIRCHAESESKALDALAVSRPLNQRRFAVAADVCLEVL